MAGYRTRSTTPNHGVDRPVLIVGHPERNQYCGKFSAPAYQGVLWIQETRAADGPSLRGRPKAFSHEQDAVYVAASDAAGTLPPLGQ